MTTCATTVSSARFRDAEAPVAAASSLAFFTADKIELAAAEVFVAVSSVVSSPSSETAAAACNTVATWAFTRCTAFAVSSSASAPDQESVVRISSGVVPARPSVSRTCCFSSSVSADASTVVSGVIATAFVSSFGKSATRTRLGKAFPVAVSVPPRETTFGLHPSAASTFPTLKNPFSSVFPSGSPSSFWLLQLRSTKTAAPATGPSITRPSNASSTETSSVSLVSSVPSLALT